MITELNDSNFTEHIQTHENVIVKYYADWCGNCKLFSPKYKRLAADERFSSVSFVDVNAEENEAARKLAGVSNLPFFAVFKNGTLVASVATSKEDGVLELLSKLN